MVGQRYPRTATCGAWTVDTWYATTADGDTVVITLPDAPAIWLIHRPHAQVYWQTEGGKGLTLSLADARQRLAMVQARALVSGHTHYWSMNVTADRRISSHHTPKTVRASRGGGQRCPGRTVKQGGAHR